MKYLPLLLALTMPVVALSQINLSVNANQPARSAPVDERVFGVNAVMWDGQTGTAQTISLVQAAGIRAVRIPGGSLSDLYHWRTNLVLPINGDNSWTPGSSFTTFKDLITGANAQAFVTVNYGTGTPQEAAAWVAYANASASLLGTGADVQIGIDSKGYDWKTAGYWSALRSSGPLGINDGMNFLRISRASPFGLRYWEIGNENYGTWEADEQAVKNDPYTYAIRAKDYIAKMKAVDPTIKIGVVSQPGENDNINNTSHPATNPRTGIAHNGWTPVMLTTLKASPAVIPDFLIYHRYEQAPAQDQPGNPETDANLLQKAQTWPNDSTALRQQLTDYLGANGAGVELVVTENNSVYASPGKQTTSLVNALYYADSIGNILKTEVNALVWWDLRNSQENNHNNSPALYGWRQYGDYGILSSVSAFGSTTAYDPYPTYYAFKLLSHFARGGDAVVQATSPNSLLSIFAVRRTDESLTLLVINKDPANTLNANIALSGFTPGPTATTYTYGKPQDTASQTGSGSTDLATGTMSISGTTFAASFASYSATVISLPRANVAPAFTLQPVNATVNSGGPVTFSVAASGLPTPTFQWQKDGVAINGATNSAYSIISATAGDAGNYTAVATNVAGSAASNAAILTVNVAPAFTTQPESQTITTGAAVTFTAAANGLPAPTYQWKKDDMAIGGATDSSFTIASTVLGDAGSYTVVATNSAGSATSNGATLAVGTPPAGFDVAGYLVRYPAVAAIYGSNTYGAWLYYHDHGIYDGEVYDDLFRVEEYLALYPELFTLFGENFGGALVHWLTIGRLEGKLGRIPLEFNATGYFTRNGDVAIAVNNDPLLAWGHYWLYGIYEGRAYDDELRVFEYLAINADLTAAFVNDWRQAALHWMRYGRTEGRLGRLPLIFNVTEYLNRNPDVAATWGTNPTTVFLHFWTYGIDEGRTFDDLFRVDEYLALNPDLVAVFGTDRRGAFKHWVRYGQAEGRPGRNP